MYKAIGLQNGYPIAIDQIDVVIDGTSYGGYAKMENHFCTLNAQYVVYTLPGSTIDVVFIEAIIDIQAGSDHLLEYGWSLSDSEPNKLFICEYQAAGCKGYIFNKHLRRPGRERQKEITLY